jgi:cation:H+ antiporter
MMYLQVAVGLSLLYLGGEMLVRGAVTLARRMRVSPLLIGLTIVAFGTSAPELVVSVDAAVKGLSGIAIGNVIGSNICNILLVLGLAAVVRPVKVPPHSLYRDGSILLGATLLALVMLGFGSIERWEGAVLLALLVGFSAFTYAVERGAAASDPQRRMHVREGLEVAPLPLKPWVTLLLLVCGIVILAVGSNQLVTGAAALARAAGISEPAIGLTLVALGTSLPEVSASIVAAIRRHSDVALGAVVGSNVFNLLGIFGAAALAQPLVVADKFLRSDIWVMLGATALLLPLVMRDLRLPRWTGALLVLAYVVYIGAQFADLGRPPPWAG